MVDQEPTILEDFFKPDTALESVDYKEIQAKLEDSLFIEKIRGSEDWKWLREAFRRVVLQANEDLKHLDPMKEPSKVLQAQIVVRLFDDFLKTTLDAIRANGKVAYAQAKDRGWISSIFKARS